MRYMREELIRFRHCDPAGIVFYPRFLEIVNDTVEDWFDDMGFPFQHMKERFGAGVPTVNLNIRFQSPCRQADLLQLELVCNRIGDSSIDLSIGANRAGNPVFEAQVVLCFTTVGEQVKKRPIPAEIRQQIFQYTNTGSAVTA
ncbi:4-hydroxybenzoyl-CoA thioesterase [Marinobacterium halophilum]|uniref:4-hydroxybenzoyl-CoA thioesterase n=1 Tax=Marinobacterium halophilum TaxID=267374 RepID=A0A2P8ERV2_9GAMM|nr:thioesterase family protein [Marinobacterium halophilum]PSL12227.1 4-hydroxybenzoyl-CoA thioesterase [Marinobacterium halophilum]